MKVTDFVIVTVVVAVTVISMLNVPSLDGASNRKNTPPVAFTDTGEDPEANITRSTRFVLT